MTWKMRLSVIGFCSAALLLAPYTLTALGNNTNESASSAPVFTAASVPAAAGVADNPVQPAPSQHSLQPEAAPKPAVAPHSDTPAPDAGASSAKAAEQKAVSRDAALEDQIRQWIGSLSKEKGFEAWSQAAWDVYPLGPGTHSWVVLLRSSGQELGYLVISSTEDGSYKLMEYGTGITPLFSMETLFHSLVQRELIDPSMKLTTFLREPPLPMKRWYIPPLQAVWQVDTAEGSRYFDAKTGEELPDVGGWLEQHADASLLPGDSGTSIPSGRVDASAEWEPHDPFLRPSWLKGKPMASPAFAELQEKLNEEAAQVTYSGKWYDGIALYPLAVSGFHLWSGGKPYVRLEHNGPRYAAYEDTLPLGGYYPNHR